MTSKLGLVRVTCIPEQQCRIGRLHYGNRICCKALLCFLESSGDCARYLDTLLREARLDKLLSSSTGMSSDIKSLDADMQRLVRCFRLPVWVLIQLGS